MAHTSSIWIRFFVLLTCLYLSSNLLAFTYRGRVVDADGEGLMYASVYLHNQPQIGTATNAEGYFALDVADENAQSQVVVSNMGYQTQHFPLSLFTSDNAVVRMVEQPLLLTPATVSAATHQSKRKRMASMLRTVYDQMRESFPQRPVMYHVVSDVKMNAGTSSWGMEQMIAYVVQMPNMDTLRADSIQFVGLSCKRFCDARVRKHANELLQVEKDNNRKRLATSIDSGTIVHRKMWELSQIDKTVLRDLSGQVRRWQMTQPDPHHSLFTYTRKQTRYLGVVHITEAHHLLVDNAGVLQSYANDLYVEVYLPISVRIKDADLSWLNLLNMDDEQLQKFRLKSANMHVHLETHYAEQDGVLLPSDKTMRVTAELEDNKGKKLPCELWANQQVVSAMTTAVAPFPFYRKSHKVARQLVPIY